MPKKPADQIRKLCLFFQVKCALNLLDDYFLLIPATRFETVEWVAKVDLRT